MSFKQGLINARSYLILMAGLIAAFGIVIKLESWDPMHLPTSSAMIDRSSDIPAVTPAALTPDEKAWATVAWRYFINNHQPTTGMVNSVDGYPASTMWDTASYLMALIAAHHLGLIGAEEFDGKLSQILTSLNRLPLFGDSLPNKSYNTQSLDMVNYNNERTERGIGWSAIDIGRLLVPFNIIIWSFPHHTAEVQAILSRWKFDRLIRDGVMYGATIDTDGTTVFVQEGRLGYEEYAAKSFALMGWDVAEALRYDAFLQFVDIYDVKVPTDSRDPSQYGAHNYVVSEPYILDGLEFGWDHTSREFAWRVYRAQEARFRQTGVLTAVSEDHIDQAPHFVYNTLFTGGKVWNAITEAGEDASAFKALSTKAVFGWEALYKTPYTRRLMQRIGDLFDPARGWYSGLYEVTALPNRAITANTNAIILESLVYRVSGPLMRQAILRSSLKDTHSSEAVQGSRHAH